MKLFGHRHAKCNPMIKSTYLLQCPIGGNEEICLGRRLKRITGPEAEEASALGQAFLDIRGRHYYRKPPRFTDLERANILRAIANQKPKSLLSRFWRELLLGRPESISDCSIVGNFRIVDLTGELSYLVTVKHCLGNTPPRSLRLTGSEFCRPTELHSFLIRYAGASWMGGIVNTQRLVNDIQAATAFREVNEAELLKKFSPSLAKFLLQRASAICM